MTKIETTQKIDWAKLLIGALVICIGMWFWYEETKYFGFNNTASCGFESICDWVAIIMEVVGVYPIHIARRIEVNIFHK